ncbi:hypothetical protein TIFTF001_014139 [Ficus carica]|uniref:Uncharacterized protein n=1 Tax=Ficus carica TaxID=3494 RepID=A0AA88A4S3_FICCA|nr:hypothetical protein TIFTF001_014139 [Ficus carica]
MRTTTTRIIGAVKSHPRAHRLKRLRAASLSAREEGSHQPTHEPPTMGCTDPMSKGENSGHAAATSLPKPGPAVRSPTSRAPAVGKIAEVGRAVSGLIDHLANASEIAIMWMPARGIATGFTRGRRRSGFPARHRSCCRRRPLREQRHRG